MSDDGQKRSRKFYHITLKEEKAVQIMGNGFSDSQRFVFVFKIFLANVKRCFLRVLKLFGFIISVINVGGGFKYV